MSPSIDRKNSLIKNIFISILTQNWKKIIHYQSIFKIVIIFFSNISVEEPEEPEEINEIKRHLSSLREAKRHLSSLREIKRHISSLNRNTRYVPLFVRHRPCIAKVQSPYGLVENVPASDSRPWIVQRRVTSELAQLEVKHLPWTFCAKSICNMRLGCVEQTDHFFRMSNPLYTADWVEFVFFIKNLHF